MSQAQPGSTDHFDRFENADAAHDYVEEREERKQAEREETVELFGTAAELFTNRFMDSFFVKRHGTEIEFYRPVGANAAELENVRDRDLAARLRHGAELLEEVERRRLETIQTLQSGDVDFEEIHENALEGTELMRETLSAHAVDESFHDPQVWTAIFRDDDTISEVFEDFTAEGEPEKQQQKLDALQSMASADDSDS